MSLLPNTVVNGNCLEVMKEIDDASIDMVTLEQTLLLKCSATSTSGKRNMGARPIC